jgi:hypothetical protein
MLMASLVVLVAVAGGLVAWATTSSFASAPDAIWWAFLRLTDPGYLGDDEGLLLRAISTAVTILGYVLFMGSMIAIMTQWLSSTIGRLESGLTPIAMKDHIVILGWTNRTPEVVLKLLGARGRLRRFLEQSDTRKLRVVVLSEDAGPERRLELREHLGAFWNASQVFLRSGSSLQAEHLERLDLLRAAVVVVPGSDFELGGSEMTDARVVKTLMTIENLQRGRASARPTVVAEIFDPLKAPIARSTLGGELQVVASDRIVSRLISQSVRHRGLAQVLFGLLAHRQGNSLYLRGAPELAGHTPRALDDAFPNAVVLGFLRTADDAPEVIMDPGTPEVLRADDLVIFLAETYDGCRAAGAPRPAAPVPERARPVAQASESEHSILVLGWSHKVSALISELDESSSGRFDITILSRTAAAARDGWLQRSAYDETRIRARNVDGDYAIEADLAALDPAGFDHVVLLASSDMDSTEAADARTILGYALLASLVRSAEEPPEVLVELLDPENAELFEHGRDVVLVTPRVMSHLLAHVALRPELNPVFDALFGAGGTEIDLERAGDLGLPGRSVTFPAIQAAASEHGMTALGVFCAGGPAAGVQLNPARDREWTLTSEDRVVVLRNEN